MQVRKQNEKGKRTRVSRESAKKIPEARPQVGPVWLDAEGGHPGWEEGPRKRKPKEGPMLGSLRRCFQPVLPSRERCEWKGNLARWSGAQHRRLHENYGCLGSLSTKVFERD